MYAGSQNGTSSDQNAVDDIHSALMSYIHEQPCTWAPILSSVSDPVKETLLLLLFLLPPHPTV